MLIVPKQSSKTVKAMDFKFGRHVGIVRVNRTPNLSLQSRESCFKLFFCKNSLGDVQSNTSAFHYIIRDRFTKVCKDYLNLFANFV